MVFESKSYPWWVFYIGRVSAICFLPVFPSLFYIPYILLVSLPFLFFPSVLVWKCHLFGERMYTEYRVRSRGRGLVLVYIVG